MLIVVISFALVTWFRLFFCLQWGFHCSLSPLFVSLSWHQYKDTTCQSDVQYPQEESCTVGILPSRNAHYHSALHANLFFGCCPCGCLRRREASPKSSPKGKDLNTPFPLRGGLGWGPSRSGARRFLLCNAALSDDKSTGMHTQSCGFVCSKSWNCISFRFICISISVISVFQFLFSPHHHVRQWVARMLSCLFMFTVTVVTVSDVFYTWVLILMRAVRLRTVHANVSVVSASQLSQFTFCKAHARRMTQKKNERRINYTIINYYIYRYIYYINI